MYTPSYEFDQKVYFCHLAARLRIITAKPKAFLNIIAWRSTQFIQRYCLSLRLDHPPSAPSDGNSVQVPPQD